jgi:hypothetical protein
VGRIKSLILGALVLLLGCNTALAQAWSEYRSEAGRYRIEMPGTPELSSVPIKVGDAQIPMYRAMVDLKTMTYLVTYIDYPSSLFTNMTLSQALEKARDGSAKGHDLLTDKAITLGSNPGREYSIARKDGFAVLMRTVMSGTRLYQAVYVEPGQTTPSSPNVRRFLDSLEITP